MQTYNKISISSKCADITLLDDGSDTELYGSCRVNNGVLEVDVMDDSTIVIPAGHYEDINVSSSTGDCSVCLTKSEVDHISVETITGDVEVEANTDNVSMSSASGSCIKKGCACICLSQSKCTKKTKHSKDEASVSSKDYSNSLEGEKN